jgi:hypothetical protein
MGSCFTDSIGERMADLKFPVLVNPFGTLFNPVSMGDNLRLLMHGTPFSEDDLYFHNGLWFSFNHYTHFPHPDLKTCLSAINNANARAASWLKTCPYLLLTFGTSWIYTFRETGNTVANCHKLPASSFIRRLIKPDEIVEMYESLVREIIQYNPEIRIIFTVSPVRHWKDGAVDNQVSKSVLILAVHELISKLPNTYYFPAYEIFMDELRDYRFYAPDMFHPAEQGVDFVWERFRDTFMDGPSEKIMNDVNAVLKAVAHRPVQPNTPDHKKFISKTLKQIQQLTVSYPFLDFTREIEKLSG